MVFSGLSGYQIESYSSYRSACSSLHGYQCERIQIYISGYDPLYTDAGCENSKSLRHYCMSKKSESNFYSNLLYKMSKDFLDIQ